MASVWIVSAGSCYEGGWTESVHATYESGKQALDVLLEKKRQDIELMREEDAKDPNLALWDWSDMKETSPGVWSDGLDYLSLKEWEILP